MTCKINAKFNRSKENIINATCYYSTILSTSDSPNDIIERFKIKVTTRVLNLDWNIQIKEQKIYEIGIKKITINNAL